MARILSAISIVLVVLFASIASAQGSVKVSPANPPATTVHWPIIDGQVLSQNSEGGTFPLNQAWNVNITISRYDVESGDYLWINTTDCSWYYQGCPDELGHYSFMLDAYGNTLQDGKYEVKVTADYHLVSRRYISLAPYGNADVVSLVPIAPAVLIPISWEAKTFGENGGKLGGQAYVCNLDSSAESMMATGTISGPGRTRDWNSFDVQLGKVALPTDKWTCQEVTLATYIDGSFPAGNYYLEAKLGSATDPLSSAWFWGRKLAGVELDEPTLMTTTVRKQ